MLTLKNISKTFGLGTVNEKQALRGIDLHLEKGDFVTVLGSNGAGKSTLFGAIAGTFLPWVGSSGYSGVFFWLAGFTVIYFITAAFFMPETKGRTLEEIEQYFTTGKMPQKKDEVA